MIAGDVLKTSEPFLQHGPGAPAASSPSMTLPPMCHLTTAGAGPRELDQQWQQLCGADPDPPHGHAGGEGVCLGGWGVSGTLQGKVCVCMWEGVGDGVHEDCYGSTWLWRGCVSGQAFLDWVCVEEGDMAPSVFCRLLRFAAPNPSVHADHNRLSHFAFGRSCAQIDPCLPQPASSSRSSNEPQLTAQEGSPITHPLSCLG